MNRRGFVDLIGGVNARTDLVLPNLAALINVKAPAVIQG